MQGLGTHRSPSSPRDEASSMKSVDNWLSRSKMESLRMLVYIHCETELASQQCESKDVSSVAGFLARKIWESLEHSSENCRQRAVEAVRPTQ